MPELWMNIDTDLAEVPVNVMPLIDDTDFKAREVLITYDQAGMDLVWNFVTTGGAFTQTAVTPTSGGVYDWTNQGDGMYTLEIPASGGASINNDTRGFGWFIGIATGVLAWRGPVVIFRTEAENNALNVLAKGAGYIGDFKEDKTVGFFWESGQVTASGGTISVYKDGNTSPVSVPTGVTETIDFGGTGRHRVEIELDASVFYVIDSDYSVVRNNITISGQTISLVIAEFSIQHRYENKPFRPGG